jgi:hypothetical protein
MEQMKETLEEAAESRYGTDMDSIRGSNVYDLNTDLKRGFIEGAKWQAERMYSEEDVKEAFFSGCQSERQIKPRIKCWEQWFEQFKKK